MADGSSFSTAAYESMGPSLLAKQPVDTNPKPELDTQDWQITFSQLENRLTALRNWRYSWWQHWSVLAEYFMPRRYVWLVTANRMWRGLPINNAIIDSTGLMAVRTCAAGMLSGLMSPFRPWFTLEIGLPWVELDAAGKAWLEDTQERAYTVLDQSNFYTIMAQAFQDLTVFGTAPVLIYEDFEDVIRCYAPAAGEYYLGSGARLAIDTFYREFTFTVAQIVEFVGDIDKCPEEIRRLYTAGQYDTERVVAHAIEPNTEISSRNGGPPVQIVPAGFTFREVYWLRGDKTSAPLSLRGFDGDPFMVARWATVSNEPYGRSPCMDALGDVKQVQLETIRKAEYIEKGIRPPMAASPELKNQPSSILPGQVTYVTAEGGKPSFTPLFETNPSWLAPITADIAMVNERVKACLFVDLFMAITQMEGVQPRNELELTQRNQERLQELGPFVKMFQNEFAGPCIRRILEIMQRKGLLKPLPPSLQKMPIKINYVSIMRLAQMALESVSMKDIFQTAGIMDAAAHSSNQKPPSRIINLDKAMRLYGKNNNAPADLFYTDDEVRQHDKIQAQQAAQAQQQNNAMAAVQAAQTLSQTQINPGNALGAMMGAPGGASPAGAGA